MIVRLSTQPIDAAADYAHFLTSMAQPETGAAVAMTGHVRAQGKDGRAIAAMELHAYRDMTLTSMERIASDAAARFDLTAGAIHHRVGAMVPGEIVVQVIAAAPHRRAAFDATSYMMDRLKSEAVLWKREMAVDGSHRWIEPTADDATALDRWHVLGDGNAHPQP